MLPFDNVRARDDDGHLADALHQEVIVRLGMMSGLKVIDRSSVFRYRGRAVAIGDVARDLSVDYVLRGTLANDGAKLRFTPVLTDARENGERWTDHYVHDPSIGDWMSIRSAVALDVAEALRIKISSAERGRISGRSTENATADNLYLRGMQVPLGLDPIAASLKREGFLKQAIDLDPSFAAAIAALATTYADRSYTLGQPGDYADRAIQWAYRAIQLDPDLGEGHRALGMAHLDRGHLRDASEAFTRLAQLQPSDGHALLVLGWIQFLKGSMAAALERWTSARTLDPFSIMVYLNVGQAERALGNIERSVSCSKSPRWRPYRPANIAKHGCS